MWLIKVSGIHFTHCCSYSAKVFLLTTSL